MVSEAIVVASWGGIVILIIGLAIGLVVGWIAVGKDEERTAIVTGFLAVIGVVGANALGALNTFFTYCDFPQYKEYCDAAKAEVVWAAIIGLIMIPVGMGLAKIRDRFTSTTGKGPQ